MNTHTETCHLSHFDKDGRPIDVMEAGRLASGKRYRRIAQDYVGTGDARLWISTVWVGICMGHDTLDRPLIFETITCTVGGEWGNPIRYATEEEAQEGHRAVVDTLRSNAR